MGVEERPQKGDHMAKVHKNNFPFGNLTGKIGDVVVRRRGDYYIISSRPRTKRSPPSQKQLAHQKRFKEALKYARTATEEGSPTRAAYERLAHNSDKSAMNMAVADWFRQPEIDKIDLSVYRGLAGDVITVYASKKTGPIVGVEVVVLDGEGHEVERGQAVEHPEFNASWTFTATCTVVTGKATFIIIVTDHPGNTVREQVEKNLEELDFP